MKRLGLLFMVLVIALGGIGAAFAAWTDTITISGQVNTGSLDLVVDRLCGTEVYKDLDTEELVYSHWYSILPDPTKIYYNDSISSPPPAHGLLIAYVDVTQDLVNDPTGDTLQMTFHNLFPLEDCIYPLGWGNWIGNCRISCTGTIPMHAKVTTEVLGIPPAWVEISFDLGGRVLTPAEFDGTQLHQYDTFEVWVMVFVPQEDAAMNQSGTISVEIEGIQWNE